MRTRLISLGIFAFVLPIIGCDAGEGSESVGSIVHVVLQQAETSTTGEAFKVTSLSSALARGEYTLFAPNEFAWERLGIETAEAYMAEPAIVEKVLRRHIVPGVLTHEVLTDGAELHPLEGPSLLVAVDSEGVVTVNGAEVDPVGLEGTNGVVHFVDRVLRDHLRSDERLRVIPILGLLQTSLNNAALWGHLADPEEPVTIFAPMNSAFEDLFPESNAELNAARNRDLLARVLRNHIVPGRISAEELQDGQVLVTLEGDTLQVRWEERLLYVGGTRVVVPDVDTGSGVVHLINDVLRDNLLLVERVQLSPSLVWLELAMARLGMTQPPVSGPATLFAPLGNSLDRIPEEALAALNMDLPLLERVVEYGFVKGRYLTTDLYEGLELESAEGASVSLAVDQRFRQLRYDEGTMQFSDRYSDIKAADGVMHLVEGLPVPPLNAWEQLLFSNHLEFREAIRRAQLQDLLSGNQPITVLAPSSKAIEDSELLEEENADELGPTVRRHILKGVYSPEALVDGLAISSLERYMTVRFERPGHAGDQWHANGTPIAYPVEVVNGIQWYVDGIVSRWGARRGGAGAEERGG